MCEGLRVLGSRRVRASAEAMAQEIVSKIVYPKHCCVFDFPVDSEGGGFTFPREDTWFSFIVRVLDGNLSAQVQDQCAAFCLRTGCDRAQWWLPCPILQTVVQLHCTPSPSAFVAH